LRTVYAYYLNDITAVYRKHSGGVFSLTVIKNLINTNIRFLKKLKKLDLDKKELFSVKKSLVKWHYTRAVRMSNDLEFSEIRPYIKKELKLFDLKYNYSFFLRTLYLYLFPKSKAGKLNRVNASQRS
jgi:hypothetical protein